MADNLLKQYMAGGMMKKENKMGHGGYMPEAPKDKKVVIMKEGNMMPSEAPEKEINAWKKEYAKWLKENDHLPDNQKKTAEQLLEMPRPKTEPPKPPQPGWSDEQYDAWGKEYDKWGKENTHLPNIQPSSQIVARFKAQKNQANTNAPVQNAQPSNIDVSKINSMDAKIQALEVKVDKIISHFGIK